MSYTKGPWRYSKGNTYFMKLGEMITTEVVYDNNGNFLAAAIQNVGEHYETAQDFRDNARLIAAAPEMYEALESALVSTVNGNALPEKVREGMIAALTKAKGGQP